MGSPSSAPSSAHLVRPCTRLKGLPDEVARPDLKEPKGLHPRAVHGLEAIVNQYLDAAAESTTQTGRLVSSFPRWCALWCAPWCARWSRNGPGAPVQNNGAQNGTGRD